MWETKYGPVRAILVPNVFSPSLRIKVHHLEELVAKDGDWAKTRYGFKNAGASEYLLNSFKAWHATHKVALRQMRNMEPPLWQTAPKKWTPLKVLPQASSTVVGGREAKKEKTATVVQGAYHLQLDKEYMDN